MDYSGHRDSSCIVHAQSGVDLMKCPECGEGEILESFGGKLTCSVCDFEDAVCNGGCSL